jgi:hypothetical protein
MAGLAAVLSFVAVLPTAYAQQNYPLEGTLELRDKNGVLIDEFHSVCPAEGVTVHATGWRGNSSVHASFHSDPVDLGDYVADAAGVLDFTFRVADVEAGIHTLKLAGTGANGQARNVEASMLCECPTPASGSAPLAVAGSALDAPSAFGKVDGGSGAFGKTGNDALTLAVIALDLVVVGWVLRLAAQRRRRTAS